MSNAHEPHYIVLVGDSGTGKSTIVEKLTGKKGRSSNASESTTKASKPFYVPDGTLIVCDTPGSNSRKEKLQSNVWIAGALNFRPVSRIFIVVKAEPRIDSITDNVGKYADNFVDLPLDVVGVLVTHMDTTVDWEEEELTSAVLDDFGIKKVVFSRISTERSALLPNILKTCNEKHNLTVNSENFLKLFKIHNRDTDLLISTREEIGEFKKKKRAFNLERKAYKGKDEVDLVFEFQTYMTDEIVEAQKRVSEKHCLTFYGDYAATEAGYLATMTNQLRSVLYEIRVECLKYQSDQSASELRRCPYCNEVWAKVEGCENTTCGNRPSVLNDMRSEDFAVLGTYSFHWFPSTGKLKIEKRGERKVGSGSQQACTKLVARGCGKSIKWDEMPLAEVPPEFSATAKISTSDIKVLPPVASDFGKKLSGMISSAGKGMTLSPR